VGGLYKLQSWLSNILNFSLFVFLNPHIFLHIFEIMEINYGDLNWIEVVQNCIQWRAFVLAVLKFRVLLPPIWAVTASARILLEKLITSAGQYISRLLWVPILYYQFRIARRWTVMSQLTPIHTRRPYFLKIHFNIIFPSTSRFPQPYLPLSL
jgi:hypothetical protein